MDTWSLPKVRPISCKDCPAFQRLHMSFRCCSESLNRRLKVINTTLKRKDLYQMVLHRPVELAAFIWMWLLARVCHHKRRPRRDKPIPRAKQAVRNQGAISTTCVAPSGLSWSELVVKPSVFLVFR